MCKDCVKSSYIDRGTTCLDGGKYFINYNKCSHCGTKGFTKIANKVINGDINGDEYEISYDHICTNNECKHLIGKHYYSYEMDIDDYVHRYLMECILCGKGSKEQYIGIKKPSDDNELNNNNAVNETKEETKVDSNVINADDLDGKDDPNGIFTEVEIKENVDGNESKINNNNSISDCVENETKIVEELHTETNEIKNTEDYSWKDDTRERINIDFNSIFSQMKDNKPILDEHNDSNDDNWDE